VGLVGNSCIFFSTKSGKAARLGCTAVEGSQKAAEEFEMRDLPAPKRMAGMARLQAVSFSSFSTAHWLRISKLMAAEWSVGKCI